MVALVIVVAALGVVHSFLERFFYRNFALERQSDGWRIHTVPRRTRLDAPQRTGFPELLPFGIGTASYEG